VIRYEATVKDGEWHEVGHRIVNDGPPEKIFEMRVRRLGATDWPGAGPVGAR
jgi:hypothetical protein